jgi:hypothetical protein
VAFRPPVATKLFRRCGATTVTAQGSGTLWEKLVFVAREEMPHLRDTVRQPAGKAVDERDWRSATAGDVVIDE